MHADCLRLPQDGIGMWGMFHELGHNMQDAAWTWSGTEEVTVNIFTLHAMDVICHIDPWQHPWLRNQFSDMRTYLQAGANFDSWLSECCLALGIYAQLARDFGWQAYKTVFKQYDFTDDKPSQDATKVDQWIIRFSKTVQHNLCPMFEFWGFPIRPTVTQQVGNMPAYLHCDETTKEMAPDRATQIKKQYGIL